MHHQMKSLEQFAPHTFRFYRHAIEILQIADVPFLIGGAYAFGHYTGITRHTKDLDLFARPADLRRILDVFAQAGYPTEITFSHWLAKVFHADDFVDVIYSSGNGVCAVDEAWFEHAVAAKVLGASVRLIPPEEMIWQKAYIMERERFDGADVNHVLRACGQQLDWPRLLARFGPDWRVLLSHLILFGFVYPNDRESIPAEVLRNLTFRLAEQESVAAEDKLCRGPLISRTQYLPDIEEWGYLDPRLAPRGKLSQEQLTRWTDAGR